MLFSSPSEAESAWITFGGSPDLRFIEIRLAFPGCIPVAYDELSKLSALTVTG
jgi:hypothetical protein